MRARILETLAQVEAAFGVEILYACESGSRGWGFESRDSDWDVRFIYRHPRDWYLSLDEGRDVIELPVEEGLDVNGWDLRKSLRLMKRANPVLLEWLSSPVVYREEPETMRRCRDLSAHFHRPMASFHHYLHMARGNFREYLKGERVWLKKYLYVLRPVLACLWIERGLGAPPMPFGELVQGVVPSGALHSVIEALVRCKKAGEELDQGPGIPEIQEFLESELPRLREVAENLPKTRPSPEMCAALDAFFRDCVSASRS